MYTFLKPLSLSASLLRTFRPRKIHQVELCFTAVIAETQSKNIQ